MREFVILPDADLPGAAHGESVAAVSADELGACLTIKVVRLPGLPSGADAFDWLDQGHTADDLLIEAERAAEWLPGAFKRERRERQRAANRARQQRFRARRRMEIVRNAVNAQSVEDVA